MVDYLNFSVIFDSIAKISPDLEDGNPDLTDPVDQDSDTNIRIPTTTHLSGSSGPVGGVLFNFSLKKKKRLA